LEDFVAIVYIQKNFKAQETHKLTEEKFSKAFHKNPSLMAITTTEGYAIDLNESFIKTTGYTREAFLQKKIIAADLIESPEILEKIKQQIRETGSVKNLEITLITKHREKIQCLLSADYIRSANAVFVLVVLNNISKLHQLTLRLNLAMNTARLAWYEFDMLSGSVIAGDNKAQMLGYNPEDYQNQHYSKWTELIHPDDYNHVMDNMKDCMLKKSDLYQVDYRIKRADGNYSWFFDRGVVFEYAEDGTPKRMTGIVVDISERKATERKLKQTLRYYEHATNNVRSIIWKTEINKEGEFINSFIIKVADKMLEYKGESLNNDLHKFISHIHPDDKEKTLKNIKKGMLPGSNSEFEYRVIKKNGEIAWLFTQSSTETDDEGRVFLFGVTMDLSQRKLAEIEINKQQKFLRQLINTIPIMIAVKDDNGKYINVNTHFADYYNLKPADILGKSDKDFIEKNRAEQLSRNDKNILKSEIPVHYKLSQETEKGKRHFEVAKVPIINYEGKQNQLLIVSNEITEIKAQEVYIQNNLSRQKALSNIAFELSELKDFDKNIKKSIETIGQLMDVSRVYVFRNSDDNSSGSNVFEWCNKGIEAQINKLQNIPYSGNPEWKQKLAANEPIVTDDIKTLYPELRKLLEPQGIKSIILYPLFFFKKFSGFIGFDENTKNRFWTEDDFEFLQTISHIIANTYERKIIGDNLRESEEMFKKITSGAMDGIILINSRGKVSYWNPAAETIFGYSRFEMSGNNLHKLLVSDDDREKYELKKVHFANTGTGNAIGKNIELKAFHKHGNQIDIELSLSSLKIKGEWHALGIVRNITDIEGNIEYANKKLIETTGYSKEEVIGQNPRILSSGKHPKIFYKDLWDTIKQGKEGKGREGKGREGKGREGKGREGMEGRISQQTQKRRNILRKCIDIFCY